MGQSRSTVRTTDQSKAQQLGGGTGFFSTHKHTTRAALVACPGNLAVRKPPLHDITTMQQSGHPCLYMSVFSVLSSSLLLEVD